MSQLSTITFSLSTKTGNSFCPENEILFFSTNRIGIDSNFRPLNAKASFTRQQNGLNRTSELAAAKS